MSTAPNDSGGVETSQRAHSFLEHAKLLQLRLLDPHEAKAQELEGQADNVAAERVRLCANPGAAEPYDRRTCKRRSDCPTCGVILARRNAQHIAEVIAKMNSPVMALFELWSDRDDDLAATIKEFRRAISNIRRRGCMRGVPRAVGALETTFVRGSGLWLVHTHQILDVDLSEADERKVALVWREITKGRGRFSLHPDRPAIAKKSARAVAKYVAKSDTWCPPAGELHPRHLETLRRALKGRRLIIEWGIVKKRKQKPVKGMQRGDAWEAPVGKPPPWPSESDPFTPARRDPWAAFADLDRKEVGCEEES